MIRLSYSEMENEVPRQLIGAEIHGFPTMKELDFFTMREEAKSRWLRPNEIYAVLCNYKYFNVNVKPFNLPQNGTIVLFDRKMLRNFRKDGHNWKKKKDGKTVKEAHEHLKVGDDERIHVYYAHGEDNPTFVRRCYWLLDKSLDHIVLVHYRETQESKNAPATPVYSSPSSGLSEPSASWPISEESESVVDPAYYTSQRVQSPELNDGMTIKNHAMTLHEINTLEWDELVVPDDPNKLVRLQEGITSFEQQNPYGMSGYGVNDVSLSANGIPAQCSVESSPGQITINNTTTSNLPNDICFQESGGQLILDPKRDSRPLTGIAGDALNNLGKDGLQSQDSFGKWMNSIISDSPGSVDNSIVESPISTGQEAFISAPVDHHQSSLFSITDVSPAWTFSGEETKILVVGFFHEGQAQMAKSNLLCVCGSACVPVQVIQPGVFRCLISPQPPGLVDLFLSFDGHEPISQLVTFEFRAPLANNLVVSSEDKHNMEEFRVQMRLARLLFSKPKILDIISRKVLPDSIKEAKMLARKTSHISSSWVQLMKSLEESKVSFPQAKDNLFELTLQSRLQEWLLERVVGGCQVPERDEKGQGVIHLCAILGYTWAVYPYAWSGLSLDYRDKFGWTALHWAGYYGREKMAAMLLSAGAKSYFVTDPTSENHGGCTAADLASKNGYDGLAAYLAEKALIDHLRDMSIAGNASDSVQTKANDTVNPGNYSEEELYLKDTLAAYRTAAGVASRIQASFREHSLKIRAKAVRLENPESEARNIIAAMKIQHAFRNYEGRKKMAAAVRIQHKFHAWKIRKDFINMRRQAIKIQAAFRGYQVRRQYKKIVWSVGVLEKAILRWRLKRKGFRGLQVNPDDVIKDQNQESDVEEDFFQASRKQAEERVERSVVKVQALFRSKRAQEEYRRMKLEHNKASAEYAAGLQDPDMDLG